MSVGYLDRYTPDEDQWDHYTHINGAKYSCSYLLRTVWQKFSPEKTCKFLVIFTYFLSLLLLENKLLIFLLICHLLKFWFRFNFNSLKPRHLNIGKTNLIEKKKKYLHNFPGFYSVG